MVTPLVLLAYAILLIAWARTVSHDGFHALRAPNAFVGLWMLVGVLWPPQLLAAVYLLNHVWPAKASANWLLGGPIGSIVLFALSGVFAILWTFERHRKAPREGTA